MMKPDLCDVVFQHVWDELDAWHNSLMLLESEVQDMTEQHPDQAQVLMDQLTEPQQLYQNAAQLAEQRTVFLSKVRLFKPAHRTPAPSQTTLTVSCASPQIPACLQECEDIVHRTACWLVEAQAWLSAPCSLTTAKSLHKHSKSLKVTQLNTSGDSLYFDSNECLALVRLVLCIMFALLRLFFCLSVSKTSPEPLRTPECGLNSFTFNYFNFK